MLDYKSIGKRISKERLKRNYTQENLAEKLFVTRQAVSKWERGLSIPDYDSLINLSELFNIDINELLNSKNNKTNV